MSKKTLLGGLDVPADRRSVLFGLGATAAAASFAPFVTVSAASASPAATPVLAPAAVTTSALGAPVPATFWNLPYTDFTGVIAAHAAPKRKLEAAVRDLDPHAELLAG